MVKRKKASRNGAAPMEMGEGNGSAAGPAGKHKKTALGSSALDGASVMDTSEGPQEAKAGGAVRHKSGGVGTGLGILVGKGRKQGQQRKAVKLRKQKALEKALALQEKTETRVQKSVEKKQLHHDSKNLY